MLGSGPGGYVAAIRASQLGLKVAIVERENLGGICLNWGCIPTKALLRSAEVFHNMKHADAYGLSAGQPGFDLAKVVARSRGVAKQLNQGVTGLMKKNKIAVHFGDGALTGVGKMSVTKDGKVTELAAKHIILATGARARDLPFATSNRVSPSRIRASAVTAMVIELRPCRTRSANTEISSPTLGAPLKLKLSAATTTHLPLAVREASDPAASAIWLISHPPNTPP